MRHESPWGSAPEEVRAAADGTRNGSKEDQGNIPETDHKPSAQATQETDFWGFPVASPLDQAIPVTLFRDLSGKHKRVEQLSMRDLAGLVASKIAPGKDKLPLLKLGTFGNAPTDAGCYRSDGNFRLATGIEADYDGESLPMAEAAERLKAAGIAALLYSSPSHTPERPRWRVLCPLATPVQPYERRALAGALNGALGGVLAPESFCVSQGYFFGRMRGGHPVEVALVDGAALDRVRGLTPVYPISGGGATGKGLGKGRTGLPLEVIASALMAIPNDDDPDYESSFKRYGLAMHEEGRGAEDYFDAFHRWAAQNPRFDWDRSAGRMVEGHGLKACKSVWPRHAGKGSADAVAGWTIIKDAIAHGWEMPDGFDAEGEFEDQRTDEFDDLPDDEFDDLLRSSNPESLFLPASRWHGKPVPEREWLVEGFIPNSVVTMLSGNGGTGKSLLALQLAVATACGGTWMGKEVARPGKALVLSAEDSDDELQRRLNDICGGDLRGLDDLLVKSLVDGDPLLASFDRQNKIQMTALFQKVAAAVESCRPSLLILDTLANLHSGDEMSKVHAVQFVNKLKGLASRFSCAVVLLTHPSLSGMANGTGSSGNTGWMNTVRSVLYLQRIKNADGVELDTSERLLTVTKNNYGSTDGRIEMRWSAGRYIALGDDFDDMGEEAESRGDQAERVFLRLLDRFAREGRYVSPNHSSTFAPRQFAEQPDAERCSKADLKAAMDRLFAQGVIVVGSHLSNRKERSHIARKEGSQ